MAISSQPKIQLFPLGQIVATIGIQELAKDPTFNMYGYIRRHATGDWGDLDDEDKKTNDEAVKGGFMLLSSYNLEGGKRLWIQTEWDRSVTTLMLPEER